MPTVACIPYLRALKCSARIIELHLNYEYIGDISACAFMHMNAIKSPGRVDT